MDRDLPHDGIWSRMGCSGIHGVGVFAIRDIPAGTNVFGNDTGAITWIDADEVASLLPGLRRLYQDFAIRDGGKLGCPENFNMMGVGWYVNEPLDGQPANLVIDRDFAMLAVRDIEEGEELTIVYKTFSA